MTNPNVFIVGCPRSGTTLLQRMVNAHPQIAIVPESHWIADFYEEGGGLTPEGFVASEVLSRLLEHPKFANLQMSREDLEGPLGARRPASYSEFVADIFDLYGKARGKSLVGNKTPGFVRKMRLLHCLWPRARFVHLIRDGRDVRLSVANWRKTSYKQPGTFSTWKDDPVATTALWWEAMVRLGRQAGNSLGPELYHEIRYESLVSGPAEECAGLCAFLGLPYDDSMLRFHEGRTRNKPGLDAKHAWLPVTRGLRDWRSQMPSDDVERFEAAAGELLDELGYPRAVPHLPQGRLESASRIRGLLAQDPNWFHRPREGRGVGAGVSTGKETSSNGRA